MTKVIIDTDTGVDDGMGLIYGILSPELHIVGVTTSFGNVEVEKITHNTAAIMERLRCEAPLAAGAARGLGGYEPHFNPEVHGEDGFGNVFLPPPAYQTLSSRSAAELIVELARQHAGELTWIGLGPITNLALALLLEPRLPELLPNIVWMGGAAMAPGNVTPVAEADAAHDPEALALVLSRREWNFLQIGLDVTDDTIFEEWHLQAVQKAQTPAAELIAAAARSYMSFYAPILGRYACAMHSPLTVGVVVSPELITAEEMFPMTVELTGTYTRGMTVTDRRRGRDSDRRTWSDAASVRVALDVDRESFVRDFVDRVTR